MSALGQKRTFEHASLMSALPPKADMLWLIAGARNQRCLHLDHAVL
jgi:hypothetical protein